MVFTAVTVGTCVFPTERDASVHVSLTPVYILFRGNDTVVTARAWQMVGSADSQPISNVVFVWTSSDPSVATVDNVGHVVGVKSGTVVITAAAANFDKQARAATDTLRVAAPLEIDSVRPKTVRYGEILSIYGVSADSIVSASLHGAALIRVPFGDTVFPSGTARSRWWVPPPARTDSLFFLGITGSSGVLGYVHGDTTTVIERDLFEPDDTVPRLLDLDGATLRRVPCDSLHEPGARLRSHKASPHRRRLVSPAPGECTRPDDHSHGTAGRGYLLHVPHRLARLGRGEADLHLRFELLVLRPPVAHLSRKGLRAE